MRPSTLLRPFSSLVLLSWACVGCDPGPTAVPPPVARVVVTPDSAVLVVGQVRSFLATAIDEHGTSLSGMEISWSSDDEAVATVDGQGVVQATAEGTARVTATVNGASASVDIRVEWSGASGGGGAHRRPPPGQREALIRPDGELPDDGM